jgi:hypothetical protein
MSATGMEVGQLLRCLLRLGKYQVDLFHIELVGCVATRVRNLVLYQFHRYLQVRDGKLYDSLFKMVEKEDF